MATMTKGGRAHTGQPGPRGLEPFRLPEAGDVVAGYRIDSIVGEGGMAVVFEAEHVARGERVAIKVLNPMAALDDEMRHRFAREAAGMARLTSPHIVRVLEFGELESGLPFIVLELLRGHDLRDELRTSFVHAAPLSIEFIVDVAVQVACGMAEAHALGTIHRDLKPSNVFLCAFDGIPAGRKVAKVLDFGVSKFSNADGRQTASHVSLGTPFYMSPEQVRAASAVDARTDVWSLGAIVFELLTGQPPFKGSAMGVLAAVVADPVPQPSSLRAIPPAFEAVILRALAKERGERYASMDELARALAPFGPEVPMHALIAAAAARKDGGAASNASGALGGGLGNMGSAQPDGWRPEAPTTPCDTPSVRARRPPTPRIGGLDAGDRSRGGGRFFSR
jgi:serine/threonine-protein kinase